MGEAIFGLIGVIVGAVISSAWEWWVRRESAATRARTARRLVFRELTESKMSVVSALGQATPKVGEAGPPEAKIEDENRAEKKGGDEGEAEPEVKGEAEVTSEQGTGEAVAWLIRYIKLGRISDARWRELDHELAECLDDEEWDSVWAGYFFLTLLAATDPDDPRELLSAARSMAKDKDVDTALRVLATSDHSLYMAGLLDSPTADKS